MEAGKGEPHFSEAVWAARREILKMACERLRRFGVPFFLWKGADFAFSLYPHPWERPMGDLDILIHEGYAGMASALLVSGGFRRYSSGSGLFTSGVIGETKFSRGGFLVELHTHPLYHPAVLPGRIPPVSALSAERQPGGHPAPGWPETALYTLLHHADSPALAPWQELDLRLLSDKLGDGGWERLAYLSVRSGWGPRIAEVLGECRVNAPVRALDAMRHNLYKKDTGKGRGTLFALRKLRGWRKTAFGAAVFYRILTGRGPGREG